MSQKEEIINKAKSLGIIDDYINNSEFETLQFIAKKVGMPSYDDRYVTQDMALKEKLDQYAIATNQNDIKYQSAGNSPINERVKHSQNSISEAAKRQNYYRNPVEALRRRQEAARAEKSKNHGIENGEEIKSNTETPNIDKEDKKVSEAKSNTNQSTSIKSKTYQITHPIKSAKETAKAKVKKKVASLLLKWWWVIAIAALIFLIFIIIILIIIGSAAGDDNQSSQSDSSQTSYTESNYDFTETNVFLTSSYQNANDKIDLGTLSLEDLVQGFVYSEFRNTLDGKTDEQKIEIFKTAIIVGNSLALSIGNYDSATKEISIQSGAAGVPYCDIYNGCKVVENNGVQTFVSAANTSNVPGTVVSTIEPMDVNDQKLLNSAYQEVKQLLLVPKTVNTAIDKFTYGNVPYTQAIKQKWISYSDGNTDYKGIIEKTSEYENYKIYDINQYSLQYNYADGNSYWWPIGSSTADANGLYSGEPMGTNVSSKYGPRTIDGSSKFHYGVDISGSCSKYVIIASKAGTVSYVHDGCPTNGSYGDSCGGGYGNNVRIDHGDGTMTVYAHMAQNSIKVRENQQVRQGEMIGLMGSSGSSTGCHLHFEVRINDSKVNPLDYINASNPRPVASSNIQAGYESGSNNIQTICLSLKQSGYSNNAVAAIMTNMQSESSFNPTALGDSGTSYGLCQWHNGRYANLKNYCGSEYSTIKCQLSYLIKELQQSYVKVNNYLGTNNSAWEMTRYYCYYFERPANKDSVCKNRANNSTQYANYVNNNCS